MSRIEITYIYHDCFVAVTEKSVMIFDYWKDPDTVTDIGFDSFLISITYGKKIYVFVSHHHKDHYSKNIFDWSVKIPNIHYVLSKDTERVARHILSASGTYKGVRPSPSNVTVLRPGETYSDDTIIVNAYGSTDIGNSYIVKTEDKIIFHAGDLNAWIWKDESTQKEVDEAISAYQKIINDIKSDFPDIDYAMFPVDARLGRDYFTGAQIFLREINVSHFIPMHFELGENERQREEFRIKAIDFKKYCHPLRGEYIGITFPYDSFLG